MLGLAVWAPAGTRHATENSVNRRISRSGVENQPVSPIYNEQQREIDAGLRRHRTEQATYRRVEAGTYEYRRSGYWVERMRDGRWDAYMPSAWDRRMRLWSSPGHTTRAAAGQAIAAERRRVNRAVRKATAASRS